MYFVQRTLSHWCSRKYHWSSLVWHSKHWHLNTTNLKELLHIVFVFFEFPQLLKSGAIYSSGSVENWAFTLWWAKAESTFSFGLFIYSFFALYPGNPMTKVENQRLQSARQAQLSQHWSSVHNFTFFTTPFQNTKIMLLFFVDYILVILQERGWVPTSWVITSKALTRPTG